MEQQKSTVEGVVRTQLATDTVVSEAVKVDTVKLVNTEDYSFDFASCKVKVPKP